MSIKIHNKFIAALCACGFTGTAFAVDDEGSGNLLQQLMNTRITSVSRTEEDPFRAPAATFVITREDISRHGFTSIPEALRMVPGLNVAQAGSERYAISARGFNDNVANRLLVQVDGRTVYTPVFPGVNWDTVDTNIEDIKQIEIVRGPGGALWGANANNGIINIITEESVNTLENYASAVVGTEERSASVRHGGSIDENHHYRLYGKFFDRGSTDAVGGGKVRDAWDRYQVGFRTDKEALKDSFTLQGDFYQGEDERQAFLPDLAPPFVNAVVDDATLRGANILGRWTHNFDDGSSTILQTYVDYWKRGFDVSKEETTTIDVNFQYSLDMFPRNQVTWGAGYRVVFQNEPDRFFFKFIPEKRTDDIISLFLQDKIALIENKLYLTVGSKFEQNDYSGFEYQPNVRVSWYPGEKHTLWGAVSRSIRTPTRAEHDIEQILAIIPNAGFVRLIGNRDFDSEELISYEVGYKFRATSSFYFDVSAFYHQYNKLRTLEIGAPFGDTVVPLTTLNNGTAESYGIELSGKWEITPEWHLTSGYSFLTIDTDIPPGNTDTELVRDEGRSPKHQFNILSHLKLPYDLSLSNALYYVDTLNAINIPSYFRFDTGLTWAAAENMSVSIIGHNLLDNKHPEFDAIPVLQDSEIERSVLARISVRF